MWAQAETLLAARGESMGHRAVSGSDYQLTGLMRCPRCGKAMLGTGATGRSRTCRYYICYARARYDTTTCDAPRLDADAVDAVLHAFTTFYRTQHGLIADAVEQTRLHQRAASPSSSSRPGKPSTATSSPSPDPTGSSPSSASPTPDTEPGPHPL